jgi:hypothetical protein
MESANESKRYTLIKRWRTEETDESALEVRGEMHAAGNPTQTRDRLLSPSTSTSVENPFAQNRRGEGGHKLDDMTLAIISRWL